MASAGYEEAFFYAKGEYQEHLVSKVSQHLDLQSSEEAQGDMGATKAPDCRFGLGQAAANRHGSCHMRSGVESSYFRAKDSSP